MPFSLQVLPGNNEQYNEVVNDLSPPFLCRYIQFNPRSWHGQISMRAEVYGCKNGKIRNNGDWVLTFDLPEICHIWHKGFNGANGVLIYCITDEQKLSRGSERGIYLLGGFPTDGWLTGSLFIYLFICLQTFRDLMRFHGER